MKKLKLLFCFSLLVLSSSLSNGQDWCWAKQAIAPIKEASTVYSVAADKYNNAYITGNYSVYVIFGSDTLTTYYENAFLVKYSSTGNVLWAVQPTVISTTGGIDEYSVTTDKSGNIYSLGTFADSVSFGMDTLSGGGLCIAKYNQTGNVVWVKEASTAPEGDVYPQSIVTDPSGNVFVTGYFIDSLTFGTLTLHSPASYNTFLAKYDSSGNFLWAKQSNGSDDGLATSVTSDNVGNVYITGEFYRTNLTFGTYTLNGSSTGYNVFVVKYASNGSVQWAKQSTGDYSDVGNSIVTDKSGNVYITGSFIDTIKFGTNMLTTGIDTNFFLVKYDTNGNVLWTKKSLKGTWTGYSLSSDSNDHIFLSGGVGNYLFINDTLQFGSLMFTIPNMNYGIFTSAFLLELDTSGNALSGSILNNAEDSHDGLWGVSSASSPSGEYVYLGGEFQYQIICNTDTLIPYYNDLGDAYVACWSTSQCGDVDNINSIERNKVEVLLYPNPNTGKFTIQLSDVGSNSMIEIYNVLGEHVYSGMLNQIQYDYEIDISNERSGIYLYRIISETGQLIKDGKFVIEN